MNVEHSPLKEAMFDEPFTLYKFRPVNKYLIESLVNRSLWFSKPSELNDPYDCRIDLRKALTRASLSSTGKRKDFYTSIVNNPQFFENWASIFDAIGVFSCSRSNANTLMWTHYADDHKGVCLEYQFRASYFVDPQFTDPRFKFFAAGNVDYLLYPLAEWLKDAPLEMEPFVKELIHKYLKSKHPAWEYEQEARTIRREHGAFELNVPDRFLRVIYFGLNCPQSDIDLITKLAKEYCGCTSFAKLTPDETEFGFTIDRL